MKSRSWLRRNWPWAVGGAFVSVHLFTWLMQRAMKSSVQSQSSLRSASQSQSSPQDRTGDWRMLEKPQNKTAPKQNMNWWKGRKKVSPPFSPLEKYIYWICLYFKIIKRLLTIVCWIKYVQNMTWFTFIYK